MCLPYHIFGPKGHILSRCNILWGNNMNKRKKKKVYVRGVMQRPLFCCRWCFGRWDGIRLFARSIFTLREKSEVMGATV